MPDVVFPARRVIPQRATYAMLASLYDVLAPWRRVALFSPGGIALTWRVQGPRIESGLFVVNGPAHRALAAGPERDRLVLIAESERRCGFCGCTENFACVGGCGWLPDGRCSSCLGLRVPLPCVGIAPGARLPRPPRSERGGGHA
jgi:hypothetical protein